MMKIFIQNKLKSSWLIFSLFLTGSCGTDVYESAKTCAINITNQGVCETPAKHTINVNSQTTNETSQQAKPSPPTATPALSPTANTTIEESRVYLDATESMRGFAAPGENNKFVALLDSIGYAMPGSRLFKFGTKTTNADIKESITEIQYSKEIQQESFYNLANNRDDLLINFLAEEKNPVSSVLITDGVFSSPIAELQPEVVKAIENWMKKGRFMGILIFSSPYRGRFWSENKRVWLDKEIDIAQRPFYAFVFSLEESGFNKLRENLSAEFPDMKAVTFPKLSVQCDLKVETTTSLEKSEAPPASPFYLYMYTPDLFNQDKPAELSYNLTCKTAKDYPISKFAVAVKHDYYSWNEDKFQKSEKSPVFDYLYQPKADQSDKRADPVAKTSPESNSASNLNSQANTGISNSPPNNGNLTMIFAKDLTSPYSLYHLQFDLSGNSNLSPFIRNLSSRDDGVPENAGKTFRFYELIAALTTIHLRNKDAIKLPEPLFVVLSN